MTLLLGTLSNQGDTSLAGQLRSAGYSVQIANGRAAILEAVGDADMVILQIFATQDLSVVSEVRTSSRAALLVTGPARTPHLLVAALEHGADDYMVRPLRFDELNARIRVRVRRQLSEPSPLSIGRLWADPRACRATSDGQPVEINAHEIALLVALNTTPGRKQRPEQLARHVWGNDRRRDSLDIERMIVRLRRLIEIDPTRPRWLVGDSRQGYQISER